MITIHPLTPSDICIIARLHLDYLRTNFRRRPGFEILSLYYKALSQSMGACGYVAEQDNNIVGFVCGIWDPGILKRELIKKSLFRLMFWALYQVMISPMVIMSRFKQVSSKKTDPGPNGYELRPIVVSPAARGTGVADLLVQRLIEDAMERGYHQMYLLTECDNTRAQKFYEKSGFNLERTLERQGSSFLVYTKHFGFQG